MSTSAVVGDALAAGRARRARAEGIDYVYFWKDWERFARGTVLLGDRVIPPYPRIARVLRLVAGLARYFPGPFQAEEKVDGYNVRIVRVGDELAAFTRSGHLCLFSTDRAPEFLPPRFFEDHPRAVLCAEVAGPENPYNESSPPFVADDVRFFVFDVVDERGRFLTPPEKWRLVERYGLPAVENYGVWTADRGGELVALLRRLHDEGREGVVFKTLDETRRIKYVTPWANLHDIAVSAELLEELPAHYYTNRLSRLLLSLDELGIEPDDALALALGRGLVDGYVDALRKLRETRRIFHTFRCRFRSERRARAFVESLNRASSHVKARLRSIERRDGHVVVTFDKVFLRSTSILRSLLRGRAMFD